MKRSLAVLVMTVAVSFFSGCGNKNTEQPGNKGNTYSNSKNEDEKNNQSKESIETTSMDQNLVTENIKWKITSAKKETAKSLNFREEIEGNFIQLKGEAENVGKKTINTVSIRLEGLEVIDNEGRKFKVLSNDKLSQYMYGLAFADNPRKHVNFPKELAPNMPEAFIFTYEVPDDAKGLNIIASDINKWGDVGETKKAMIDLGL